MAKRKTIENAGSEAVANPEGAPQAQLKNDLELEYDAVKRLNEGIKLCVAAGDNGSRDLAQKILDDEEHHIDWLEGQLHAISEMGIANYLSQQLKEDK